MMTNMTSVEKWAFKAGQLTGALFVLTQACETYLSHETPTADDKTWFLGKIAKAQEATESERP